MLVLLGQLAWAWPTGDCRSCNAVAMAEYAFVVSVGVESFDWGTQGDEWVHRVSECMAETDSFFSVQLANNPGGGRGGTCFGDSGGPTLLGDTDVIVGVTSWGFSPTCGVWGSPTGPTSRP